MVNLLFIYFLKDYANQVAKQAEEYDSNKDTDLFRDNQGVTDEPMFALFKAGQSRRIWGELYKVIFFLWISIIKKSSYL